MVTTIWLADALPCSLLKVCGSFYVPVIVPLVPKVLVIRNLWTQKFRASTCLSLNHSIVHCFVLTLCSCTPRFNSAAGCRSENIEKSPNSKPVAPGVITRARQRVQETYASIEAQMDRQIRLAAVFKKRRRNSCHGGGQKQATDKYEHLHPISVKMPSENACVFTISTQTTAAPVHRPLQVIALTWKGSWSPA